MDVDAGDVVPPPVLQPAHDDEQDDHHGEGPEHENEDENHDNHNDEHGEEEENEHEHEENEHDEEEDMDEEDEVDDDDDDDDEDGEAPDDDVLDGGVAEPQEEGVAARGASQADIVSTKPCIAVELYAAPHYIAVELIQDSIVFAFVSYTILPPPPPFYFISSAHIILFILDSFFNVR